MPKFDLPDPEASEEAPKTELEKKVASQVARVQASKAQPPKIIESRCDVCQSPYRDFIDAMLVKSGANYSEIARKVPGKEGKTIDRRSVANHAKNHLAFMDDAMRTILEAEAEEANQNYEDNYRGAITHRGTLEVALRKAFGEVASGNVEFEAKDLVLIVNTLQKMDEQTNSAQVDFLRAQTSAFIQAIKEETDLEVWARIADRARRLMSLEGYKDEPESDIVEAEVIELPPAG